MDILSVRSDLQSGALCPVYIFTGEETTLRLTYVEKMKALYKSVVVADKVSDVFKRLSRLNIDGGKTLYIVYNDKEFLDAKLVNTWARLLSELSYGNTIILVYDRLDKRGRFYKDMKPFIVDFERLSPTALIKNIQKQCELPDREAAQLAEYCGMDYGCVINEIDKIKHYASVCDTTHSRAFGQLVASGFITAPPEDTVFKFVEAVCTMDSRSAWFYYGKCVESGEPPLVMLRLLFDNFKAMHILRVDGGGSGVCDRTGLSGFQCNLALKYLNVGRQTEKRLKFARVRSAHYEADVKLGMTSPEVAVPLVIAAILGRPEEEL